MTTWTILSLLGFAGALLVVNAENPYCKICNVHTMCQTTSNGRTCYGKLHQSMPPSESEKAVILHSHNRLRNKVANGEETNGKGGPHPSAANMMMMEWDDELAAIAQRAADQCDFSHDCNQCRTLIRDRKGVGQNAALRSHSDKQNSVPWKKMVENFYLKEVNHMPPQYASKYVFGKNYGHYSQIVWWNSRLVGCGASMYKESGWYKTLIFCNYRTSANFNGANVYEVGSPASNCPIGTQPSNPLYSQLCAIQGARNKSTFHTDGQLLGLPKGTYALPGKCVRKGFRLKQS